MVLQTIFKIDTVYWVMNLKLNTFASLNVR